MTTSIKLALPKLFDDVVALMATWAGVVTALEHVAWSGTSSPSIAGTPTAAAEIRVRFPTGGTVGTTGILYQVSTDDGSTWGTSTALGTGTTIAVLGVTLTLGAGSIVDASVLRWTQTGSDVVPHRFGWRERTKHEGVRRIVWEPGDDGDLGEIAPVRQPGRITPGRPLWTLHELCTVYLEAVDQSSAATAENERAQYIAARMLFDAWARALYLIGKGTVSILGAEWLDRENVRRFGATLRVVFAVDAMIPDALQTTTAVDTVADVATTTYLDGVHDTTDTETVSPTDTP